ncbi:HEAT repeat domain-containing protein, partial [Acidobacteriota bacterium]
METAMTPFDHFDRILSDFKQLEERLFLDNVREFAQEHPEVVIKTFSVLLKKQKLNIQLKYLVLKSIRELKYPELIPALKETLNQENKAQIISEAVNSLAAIGTLPAYKVITGLMKKQEDNDYKENLEQGLKTIFTRNQLVYHFDVFYRDRGSVGNIDRSSEFLFKHLPDENIKELLPGLTSRFSKIRMETLRILKSRPNPIYYSTIYHYFKENAPTADEELFLLMSEALVNNASLSNAKMKIFQKLKVHQEQLKGDKRTVFSIVLLKLNTREIIPHIVKTYPKLNLDRKLLLFEHLNPGDYLYYMGFTRELLRREDNQNILAKIVEILVYANDFKYLFET